MPVPHELPGAGPSRRTLPAELAFVLVALCEAGRASTMWTRCAGCSLYAARMQAYATRCRPNGTRERG